MTRFFRSVFFRWVALPPLGCLSLLLLAGTIGWFAYRHAGAARRDAAVAKLDAEEPLWRTTALTTDRNARLPPPEENAAYQAAKALAVIPRSFKQWTATERLRKDLKPGHLPHQGDVPPARRALAESKAALEVARSIRTIPGGGFPLTFKEPDIIGTLLPDLQNTRELASLLDTHALVAAHDRKGDEAFDSVHACLAVGRGISDEPILVSQLVRIAVTAVAARSAERVLGMCEVSEEKLAGLQTAFAAEAEAPRFLYGLRGERAMVHRMLENMEGGQFKMAHLEGLGHGLGQRSAIEELRMIPLRSTIPDQQATGLRLFERMIDAAKQPPGPARDGVMDAVEDEVRNLPWLSNLFIRLLLPAIGKVNEADTRTAALLRCGSVALACERYRLKHLKYPETLDELPKDLLPAVPADPYTGKPLLYKKTADGTAVYCTGSDRRDDGGTDLDASARKGDFGFRLFDPKHRRQPPLPRTDDDAAKATFAPLPTRNPAPALPPRKP